MEKAKNAARRTCNGKARQFCHAYAADSTNIKAEKAKASFNRLSPRETDLKRAVGLSLHYAASDLSSLKFGDRQGL